MVFIHWDTVRNLRTVVRSPNFNQGCERFLNILVCFIISCIVIGGVSVLCGFLVWNRESYDRIKERKVDLDRISEFVLPSDGETSRPRNPNCRFWDCLDIYRCGQDGREKLTIYVYPLQDYVDRTTGNLAATFTHEFYEILEAVINSHFYTSNPNEACLFLSSIDILNQNLVEKTLVDRALSSLTYWDNGKNHVVVNMLSGTFPTLNSTTDVNTDSAIIFGGNFDTWSYRTGFDISIPVWSPALYNIDFGKFATNSHREYLLVVGQLNILPRQRRVIQMLYQDNPSQLLLLEVCKSIGETTLHDVRCDNVLNEYAYPSVLSRGTFCLLGRSLRLGQPDLLEILAHNCIPVVVVDNYILPFEDILDWSLASIRIRESDLHSIVQTLKSVSKYRILEMQQQISWLYSRYFKDLRSITLTALEIVEGRIFPHKARSMYDWNAVASNYQMTHNPLFLPLIASKSLGFTAVILTYDRVESLHTLIQKLAVVPSLQNILVIWNNQKKSPPHISTYPAILKPIKIIQTRANKLSNRFYPYAEIETEAILTIDDDIVMLTADELEFGFEVWREFPDRIVGFPSRIHVWDNVTMQWHYESEWTNHISMVLTGAAFHHKFWSHMYTYAMPGDIKEWVDEHMNCEDIAMNFLVANITNKSPIKVTPRKKFKCPECINTEMLSADLNHMRERSSCIDRFSRIYGRMPLRSVEFRADPVLFKDNFPHKLKRFNDVGSL